MEHKTKQCIRLKFVIITGLMTGVLIALPGCISAFSDMQSARMLGPQNIEVTHGFSSVHFDETGQPIEHSYNNFSVQLGKGVSDKMDFRLRYDYSWGKEPFWEDTSVIHIFSLGPKFSLLKNRRALYIPVGFVLGKDVPLYNTVYIAPTLLFTYPVNRNLDFNPSVKLIFPFPTFFLPAIALNLGAGVSMKSMRWTFRPEAGLYCFPGAAGLLYHCSLGLSYCIENSF